MKTFLPTLCHRAEKADFKQPGAEASLEVLPNGASLLQVPALAPLVQVLLLTKEEAVIVNESVHT